MIFIGLLKIASTVCAAIFGILGLLKDFRDKNTGEITKYGYMLLIGIVLSSMINGAIQIFEKIEGDSEKAAASTRTLEIVRTTQQTVQQIKRVLWRIGRPTINVDFNYKCLDVDNDCKKFVLENASKFNPKMMGNLKDRILIDTFRIDIFKNESDLENSLHYNENNHDLSLVVEINQKKSNNYRLNNDVNYSSNDDGSVGVSVIARLVDVRDSNGSIIGVEDLDRSYFMITGLPENFILTQFYLTTEGDVRTSLKLINCKYQKHFTFLDGQPTIFNHLGDYSASCKIGLAENIK